MKAKSMLNPKHRRDLAPFEVPLGPTVVIGSVLATLFYGLIRLDVLSHPLLKRYALCHLVAVISVYMFSIAMVAIAYKVNAVRRQRRLALESESALREIMHSAPTDSSLESAEWLETLWKAQSTPLCQSWLGKRLASVLSKQTKRGSCRMLDEDLRDHTEHDADSQHDSFGLIRIMTWAMPMLGFLGTVIGISETLGGMDTKSLASGSQEAMDKLTAGLYVAFDTTAVGLVLTILTMFALFVVSRLEVDLLGYMNRVVADNLQGLLKENDAKPKDAYQIQQTIRLVAEPILEAMQALTAQQVDLWKATITEAQSQWSSLTERSKGLVESSLITALDQSLNQHVKKFEKAQSEGIIQIDARYHQWQTTLSEQTRILHSQQTQVQQQTTLITDLIDKSDALNCIQNSLQQNLQRLTDIDRFHEVAICLTEAVAVLGTQMERAGYLGKQSMRRKATENASIPESFPVRKAA